MFKRGGSSYQSQGTGITSPYDTPRKRYALGSWEDWETKTRDITKDPRGDWSYAAQGFSSLGNPYKESGAAKTIGEMLYEGAQGVRGSKEKARELEQKGELAILESQGGRMLTEEERAWKEEQAIKKQAHEIELAKQKGDEYLKKTPLPRLILDMTKEILKTAVPGSFEAKYAPGLGKGRAIAAKKAGDGITVGVIEDWKDLDPPNNKWDYNADNMRADVPWFNPVKGVWHIFNDDGKGMVTGDPVKSFLTVDEAIAYLKGGNQEIIEKTETLDESNANQAEKKVVEKEPSYLERDYKAEDYMPKASPDVIEESIKTADETGKSITDFWNWVASPKRGPKKLVQKAKGGRIGYETGDLVDPSLGDLNSWWKSQLNSDTWNKEIKDEG